MGRLTENSWKRTAWVLLGLHLAWRTVRWAQGFPIWGDEAFVAVNFWDRGYGELIQPLEYGQIGPLFWLWLEKAMFDLFGPWERALRLPAFLAGVGSALLFFRLAFRILPMRAAALAVAVFAASYYPVRHGAELKPYSTDLLVALAMFSCAWDWLQSPRNCATWKKATLVTLAVLGPWISLPSMFVAGGCLLVLGVTTFRRRRTARETKSALLGYGLWAVALGASALWMVTAFAGPHAESASWLKEMAMWKPTFPPISRPWELPLWLVKRHCGYMAAYPTGGRDWGSTLSFLLMVGGAVAWWRSNRRTALALLTAPLLFNFVAAALERYPYGGSVRVSLFLAPASCLLMGTAIDSIVRRFARAGGSSAAAGSRGDRGRMSVVVVLAAFAGLGLVRDLIQPHKLESDRLAADFASELAELVQPGDRVLGYSWYRAPNEPGFFEQAGSLARLRFQLRRALPVEVEWDAPLPEAGGGRVWLFNYRDDNQSNTPFDVEAAAAYREAWVEQRGPAEEHGLRVFRDPEQVELFLLPRG